MKVTGYLSNLLVLLIACCSNVVFAHLPHDDTRFIALSPNYGTDATAFVTQKQGHNFRPHVALVTRDGGYSWEYNPAGMNNTSQFNSAAVSPLFAFDNKVFMTSQSDGVYYSSDAGTTWSRINQGLPALNLRDSATGLDPDSAVQLYVSAADGGLYRTGDSGATWETVLDSSVFAAEFALSPDYAVDGTIIVGDNTGTIYISTDGGASFTQNNSLQGVGNITRIGFTPDFASSGEIIVATTVGLYRSLDSGQTYTQIQSFASERVYALAVSPNYRFDGTIFAATATSVFRSTDAGLSWSTTATDIQLSDQSSEHFFDLQVSENFTSDGIIYLAAFEGLFISSDGGLDWDELDTRPATLVMDVAMSPDYQQDGLILASTYGGGLYITDDAGLNWRVSNTGVSNTYTYQVEIRQGTGMTPVMIATQIDHVLISTDLGASWTRKEITGVLPRNCIPSSMDVSRTYATDQSILLGCHTQGVVLTQDGGNTWQLLLSETQLNGGSITSVQFSPDFAVDSTMYFVDIRGYFIRSNDAGNTWSVINSGLPAPSSWFGGTAISLSDNFAIDNVAAAATPKGLYASVDRGNSWWSLTLDPSSPVATGIIESTAVSPDLSNDGTVLASVRGQGLFRTIDGGQSWQAVGSGLLDQNNELKTFVFSPNFAGDGEIVGFGHDRILRSTDRGLSFQAMDIPFIRHEDERDQSVGYTGIWEKYTWEPASGTTGRATRTAGNEVSLSFVGTGISWIGARASMLGVAEVYLDDVLVSTVDQYSPSLQWQEELFSLQGLPLGLHEIRLRVTDTANPGSTGNWTIVDAFDTWRVTAPPLNTPPDVTNPGDQSNTVGDSGVSLQIVASDADGDALSYSASGLPASLDIDAGTGLISGDITAAAGSFNVTVTVTDDGTPTPEATSVNFTWTVTAPPLNTPPDVTNPGNQSNTVGDSGVSLQIVASDADGNALSYSASGLPASLGINAGTGLVSGDITAAAGSFNVTVTVTDDGTPAAEATSVNFTWTVAASPGLPSLSIASVQASEGDAGIAKMTFTVRLSSPSSDDVSVRFATADGSATAGLDYVTASDQLSFSAGDTSRSIAVDINGDTDVEASETLIVILSAAHNASLATASATGTILNDDFISGQPGIDNRPDNQTCIAPARPSTNANVAVIDPYPGLPDITQPTKMLLEPVADPRWFVLQKEGQLVTFDPDDATSLDLYGDFSGWVRTERAGGLLGMAFHPDYPATPEIFLYYTIDHSGPAMRSVISRFILDNIANPGAGSVQQVILQVDQDFDNHNGGDIAFGADGYLYIGFGDGGSGGGQTGDPNNRAQDTTNMLGSMLRIDVNGPGVSFPANPYEIPPDNPFAGENKCLPGLNTHPCPEIYAWGFRNPYRWSFDDDTGQLWVGDVGELAYEEIDVVENGGNYGWRCREGAHDFKPNGCGSGLIDPVFEYPRGQGSSLTGGYVYRGSAIPELVGRYVFADFVSGQISALQSDGQGGYLNDPLIDTNFGATSFGVDADGELYFTDLSNSRLRMLVPAGPPVADTIPELLSASGCTDPTDVKLPYSGLLPYDINAPFWSDGVTKERFIALPNGSTITRDANDDWQFPNGTVIVKNFRIAGNLVETRHLMRHPDGVWAGYTYEWDVQQSEARRVRGGKTVISNGQPWIFPSESECMSCHTSAAEIALGPETAQLNRTLVYPSTGRTAHQLETMDNLLMFTTPLPPVSNLPRLTIPADTAAAIDDRARAYLHTNCSQCHRPDGPTPASMDLRYDTPLSNTDACDVAPALGDLGIANARLIAPGDALRSIVVRRMMRRDSHGMPPLGSVQIDDDGIDLLSDWITGLGNCMP